MNKLSLAKRVQILNLLNEGVSLRATSRLVDVSIDTVSKLLVDAGETCLDLHDQLVTHVEAKQVQCDEIWGVLLRQAKERRDGEDCACPRRRCPPLFPCGE